MNDGEKADKRVLGFDEARALFQAQDSGAEPDESGSGSDRGPERTGLPEKIGEYLVEAEIGEGGSGVVLRGRRAGSQQSVAIKLMKRSLGNDRLTQRAWRELDLLANVESDVIPRLHEFGEHEGRLYLVNDFIEGESLLDHADEKCPGLREKVELLINVALSVQKLHELGIIHRDLKPANAIVRPGGAVALVDLGLAIRAEGHEESMVTIDGDPVGTPAYMSPEQARGEVAQISTRSDLYSLAAIGCRLLTGTTPHDMSAPIHEIVRRVAQDPAAPSAGRGAEIPADLAGILDRGLAFAADDRFASASEFAADLTRWLEGRPVESVPTSRWRQLRMAMKRNPGTALAVGLALASLMVATLMTSMFFHRAAREKELRGLEASRMELLAELVDRIEFATENRETLDAVAMTWELKKYVDAGLAPPEITAEFDRLMVELYKSGGYTGPPR